MESTSTPQAQSIPESGNPTSTKAYTQYIIHININIIGRGIYEFPDGSIYDGQWNNHKLHGEGVYIDREGLKWEGEFVNGLFQSKMQKILKNQKLINNKQLLIIESANQIFNKYLHLYSISDKKTLKDNLNNFYLQGIFKQLLFNIYF